MKELIEKLERAAEGSRAFDRAIHRITHPDIFEATPRDHGDNGPPPDFGAGDWISDAMDPTPHYTTSIDAALTLVPEGCEVEISWGGGHLAYADCRPTTPASADATAPTPALAICIAALRARAALTPLSESLK